MEAHYESFRDMFGEECGLEFTRDEFRMLFEKITTRIVGDYLSAKGVEGGQDYAALAERKQELFRERYVGDVEVLPGAAELLKDLRGSGLKAAVASNSPRANIEAMMEETGMRPHLDAVVAVDEISRPKPDPEIFLRAAEDVGVKPSDCVVVEDSVHGVEAGKSAGMQVVAVLTGGATGDEVSSAGADLVVESLEEVDSDRIQAL